MGFSIKRINKYVRWVKNTAKNYQTDKAKDAAGEATRQILKIAFENLGLNRVYLNVLADNGRANAFYRKAGFRYTHTEENALEIRGEMKNLNWYEIGKEDYDR